MMNQYHLSRYRIADRKVSFILRVKVQRFVTPLYIYDFIKRALFICRNNEMWNKRNKCGENLNSLSIYWTIYETVSLLYNRINAEMSELDKLLYMYIISCKKCNKYHKRRNSADRLIWKLLLTIVSRIFQSCSRYNTKIFIFTDIQKRWKRNTDHGKQ